MINIKLVTKNKKIFLKKFSTDFILDDFQKTKLLQKIFLVQTWNRAMDNKPKSTLDKI